MTEFKAWLLAENPDSRAQATLGRSYLAWLRFYRNPLAMIGLVIVVALILMALFAPYIAPYGMTSGLTGNELALQRFQPPSAAHWFGTDGQANDVFSRIVIGSRITLLIVAIVIFTAPILGFVIGTVSGYFGGWVDGVLMRLTDIFLAFPKLVLALALAAAMGRGLESAIFAIAVTSWPAYARLARAETLTIRNTDYLAAAKLQGASHWRLITGHIMPLCLSSLIVRVTLDMAGIILTAAGLGFLGLGAQPPIPEWGAMIAEGRDYILSYWWLATFPGLAIFTVALGFNLLGDGLRDVLDPKSGA
ncbi:ABC transporter permease [Marinomonas pollencensis]|uniref:Peptide/nickel transport system permease protein n=1 Tax=Marinomonas pollencensis TaxID=491954 RepID=A0A3E0DSK5_9GAMM|nr:ABC transporter permease [Marinomonas pollencensis]REG84931.1 peptide/nickel transport system permease protein [Marinomonas pollencensis]